MKKILYTLITIISIISISCKRETVKEKIYSDKEIIEIYSKVGQIHNEGLDIIYSEIEKNKIDPNIEKESKRKLLFKLIDEKCINFVSTKLQLKNIDINVLINNPTVDNSIKLNLKKDLVNKIKGQPNSESLSESFYLAMEELNILVDKEANINEFELIINKYIKNMTDFDEKSKLVSCVYMGYYSKQYWMKNLNKWKTLIVGLNSNQFQKRTLTIETPEDIEYGQAARNILKSDISGIIVGGVGGCALGAMGGSAVFPVVGTLTGCAALGGAGALTGGLGGSAKTAVDSFIDWLTK